jgi:putative ABC transport system ATP-binding protein
MRKQKPIIQVKNVQKTFKVGKGEVPVLKDINVEIDRGEFVIIFGPSGCGKSTFLNTIVGLEKPTSGEVIIEGENVYELKSDKRATFRRKRFGIVYQQSNWIKSLNVLENVAFPLCLHGVKEKVALKRAKTILNLFRLEEFAKNIPSELSGGQQQKVSVTRALVTNPSILIADEPTGNLDSNSAADLMYLFEFLNEESKRTIIMVTHNPDYERYATKVIKIEDGRIKSVDVKRKVNVAESETMTDIIPETEGAEA